MIHNNRKDHRKMKRVSAMCFALCCMLLGAVEQAAFVPAQWVGRVPGKNIKTTAEGITVEKTDLIQSSLNQVIKVDPNAVYMVSGEFKSLKKDPKELLFFGLGCMDQKMTHIGSCEVLVFPGTETAVVKDTPRGSKTILVKDASKWPKRNQAHILGFNVKAGYADLPNRNFSGNIISFCGEIEDSVLTRIAAFELYSVKSRFFKETVFFFCTDV